ncbi:TetR/AcrR family transcriptional regulator [Amycolatopsis sp. NPDC005961]|uniref:TetR/AcrR family transcriptional regulator n=1 Tax=Amycolatopsis sp. NPDC005961 TaxID=3156720 RepID=UPI0033FD5A15
MSESRGGPGRQRELRRDAIDNRDRVLAAAAVAVRREGTAVPMATIAADAGVGVGTVYRHYPSRDALLGALTHRSFQLVLETARRAAALDGPPIERIRFFLERTIEHGSDLVLPMHGGPAPSDQATVALRDETHRTLGSILEQGRDDGTIRADVTRADIVSFGALLAQGLPHVPDWKATARRQADIYLTGLLNRTGRPDADRRTVDG